MCAHAHTHKFFLSCARACVHTRTNILSVSPSIFHSPSSHSSLPPSLSDVIPFSLPSSLSLSLSPSLAHALAFAQSLSCTKHACLHSISPTHTAAQNGHIETAKFLLSKGADVNLTDIWSTSVSFICIYVERGFYTLLTGV